MQHLLHVGVCCIGIESDGEFCAISYSAVGSAQITDIGTIGEDVGTTDRDGSAVTIGIGNADTICSFIISGNLYFERSPIPVGIAVAV